jgi:oxygen-independent coproporphyrinogen-3 oxidase
VIPHPPPLSLYVHIPWCVRKCPYCDFNSHEQRGEIPEGEYVDALIADLEASLADVGAVASIRSSSAAGRRASSSRRRSTTC